MQERVQKIMSQWGIASRRQAEKLILAHRVRLNGKIVELGQKADPQRDRLEVDGRWIQPAKRPKRLYFLLHKPLGAISTCRDPQGRKTVIDLFPAELRQGLGLHPVGRLDAASTGALLVTNDGAWTQAIAHPRAHLPKTYQVWLDGHPSESILQKWREGVVLFGQKTLPAEIEMLASRRDRTLLKIVLCEGRNRQIRWVARQLGFEVLKLHRTSIGPIQLQPPNEPMLPRGCFRPLKASEIKYFRPSLTELKNHCQQTSKENLV